MNLLDVLNKETNVAELNLFKEHNKVNQFRMEDSENGIITGGLYINLAYINKSTKRIRVTIEEI